MCPDIETKQLAMERPNNNHSPYRYNANIEPPINHPPPQSSHGGNTARLPPPAHMYNQHAYSYNTNSVAGTSQPSQPTHFGHVGNTARLPPTAHTYNQPLSWNNANNVLCNTIPPQPTQFSCGGSTAILPARAHMNNQLHSMNSAPWNSQPSQPLTHGAHTAMPTPSACVYTQHWYGYNTNRMPWNSPPPQSSVHGPDTAMATPPASVNTHHSYRYSTNNVKWNSQPQQQAQSMCGGYSAIQRYSLATNFLSNQHPVPQSQMYPAARTPQPVLVSQNCSHPSLPAPSSVQSHALQAQSSSVMTQGQGHLHVTSPSIYLLPAQQSQCQQSLLVSASQNQTSCHTSPSALSKTTSPQPNMPSSGGSSTVSGQLTSCQSQSTPSTSVMASSSQGQPLPGPTQTTTGCSLAPLQNHIQASLDFWLQCVNEWYPDRHQKTYFLPHLFFRKTQHRIAAIDHLGNLPVLVSEPPPKKPKVEPVPLYPPPSAQTHPTFPVAGSVFTLPHSDPAPLPRFIETDVLDDDAAERLLRCLRALFKEHREVMMVISQLDFRKYLDNDTDPISTAACANLPRPVTMKQQQHHDGDFDVLIIHRHYGLMVCEVKAVGADRRNTPDLNRAVVGKVQKAVKQLNKAKTVLNHLVSDMVPVQVTKTLVLPNVTSAELLLALSTSYHLQQDLSTVDRLHQSLVTACRLKQALTSVPSLQSDCSSCEILQRELCKADKLKKELDRACQLQQELDIACRLQHDLTTINKIQQELATVCKLQEELSNVCQLQQDISNISQLQKELTTACDLQTNLSTTSQLQATPESDAQREHVKSTASELREVISTMMQQLQKLGKGSQLHKAVGKAAQLQQVLNKIYSLQQELSNTSQQQQSLSTTSQLQKVSTNISRLRTALNTAFQTQQNTGSVSQLEELRDTAQYLGWGIGDTAQLQRKLCTASCLPETLSWVSQLQQELNGVSQLQQSLSNASELQQELDLTNTIQQALRADHRLQRAPETTDELQAALSSIFQLRQELMTTSQLQQELDIVSRLQHKLCMASQTPQATSGSLLTRPELSILFQLHQALDTAAKLQQLFSACQQGQLWQDLCTCLDAKDISEAITRCLCADQIPSDADFESLCNQGDSPGETNQSTSGASTSSSQTSVSPTFPLLSSWWQNMTSQGAGPDPHMSDTVYDKLLARFCGPATTVEVPTVTAPRKAMAKPGKYTPASKVVRTEGEAVAETGLIHSLLALYPDQVDLLGDNTLRCVHLSGPPGTGKTVVLVLKAIQWLHQGHDVHVVSVEKEIRAVSFLIERQLQCVLGPNPASGFGTVHRHVVEGYPYTDDVNKLAALANGKLYVIADEVVESTRYMRRPGIYDFEYFIKKLHTKIPSLSMWCASVQKLTRPPSWMCERQLTTPLRCPPTVTKEVAKSKKMKASGIPSYSSTPAPAATEGPPVRWLPHKGGQDGHGKGTAMNCSACGDAVVQLLKELGVGQSSGPDSLQYRDVLVLGPSKRVKTKGKSSKRAETGLTGKLLDSGIPLQILTQDDEDTKLRDVALGLKNEVTVSDYVTVSGLERRVVIGTGSTSDQSYLQSRLLAMSRCTAQLAWIGDITQR